MNRLAVYDGHFWLNIDGILEKERRSELLRDLKNTDRLLLVKNNLWARIEHPHPDLMQKARLKAEWRPEDIHWPGSSDIPDLRG